MLHYQGADNNGDVGTLYSLEVCMRKTVLLMTVLGASCLTLTGCALTLGGLATELAFSALSAIISSLASGAVAGV